MYYINIFIILLVIIGCRSHTDSKTNTKIYHPTRENIPDLINGNIREDSTVQINFNQQSALILGQPDGEFHEIFGEVIGAHETPENRIVVVDNKLLNSKTYSLAGEMLVMQNMAGRGPGEFTDISKSYIYNNYVFIADKYFEIEKYEFTNDSLRYTHSIPLSYSPKSLCSIDGYLVVKGINTLVSSNTNNNIIHIYELESGNYKKSIGEPYSSGYKHVTNLLSEGPIACDQETKTVIFGFTNFPYLFSISLDGDIQWISSLSGFKGPEVTQYFDKGRLVIGTLPVYEITDYLYNIVNITTEEILVQTRSYIRTTEEYFIRSFVVNKYDGNGYEIEFEDAVLLSSTDEAFILYSEEDYPKVIRISKNL